MSRFVLDASVAVAWVVDRNPNPYAEAVRQRIRAGSKPLVPALWQLEIANVLTLVRRRKVLTEDEVEEGLDYFQAFAATVAEVDLSFLSIQEAFRVSKEVGVTAYDAVYFELARRENLPLATLDKALREGATRAGVAMF